MISSSIYPFWSTMRKNQDLENTLFDRPMICHSFYSEM